MSCVWFPLNGKIHIPFPAKGRLRSMHAITHKHTHTIINMCICLITKRICNQALDNLHRVSFEDVMMCDLVARQSVCDYDFSLCRDGSLTESEPSQSTVHNSAICLFLWWKTKTYPSDDALQPMLRMLRL